MQKKLTVTIDEEVYEGLREVIGTSVMSYLQCRIKHDIFSS